MKITDVRKLIDDHSEFCIVKQGSNEFLLIDFDSPPDILRGFKISCSRFSDSMSIWFSPIASFPSSDIIVFQSYNSLTGDREEMFFGKGFSDENSIIPAMRNNIHSNLEELRNINCSKSMELALESNKDFWLSSVFSVAQFSLLLLSNGKKEESISEISRVLNKININNPLYGDIKIFYELITSNRDAESYVNQIKLKNSVKFYDFRSKLKSGSN